MSTKQPSGYLVGYARVSTKEQKLELQIDALLKAGVHADNLHVEKVSAATARRPALDLAIKDLREGDTLLVWRIDRLARSVRDLHARLDQIYKKRARFKSLTEDFDFDTISGKLALEFFGLVSEFERQIIGQRTAAGIAALKVRRGKSHRWGRKVIMTPEKIKIAGDYLNGRNGKSRLSGPKVASKLGVSTAAIYQHWKQVGYHRFVRKRPKNLGT
jgi:DNA invertase Pin-like site-specific DNA recombinase